jgi:nitroreductase
MKRRAFVKGVGAVSVLVAGGGVWYAFERGVFSAGQGEAYEPWRSWRSHTGEGPLALVRAAILAASPHNTQPWLFRVSASRIDLLADPARNIGAIDPELRERDIGIGCALENLMLAAAAEGLSTSLTLLPDPSNPAHAARIELAPGARVPSDLYDAIPRRHTNRGPYDRTRPIAAEILDALAALGRDDPDVALLWHRQEEESRRIGDLIVAATKAIIADEEQSRDSARWYRLQDWKEIQRRKDGITLDAMGSPAWLRAVAKMMPPQSRAFNDRFWLDSTRDVHVATAAAFGLLTVRDPNDRAQRIRCGRLWQRIHLWATARGLAMQPLNQMPERAVRERILGIEPQFGRALSELAGGSGMQVLMVFRIGYPKVPALPSPRRPVKDVVL